jgi:hypothetical protein
MLNALRTRRTARRAERRRNAVLWVVGEHGPTTAAWVSHLLRWDATDTLDRLEADGAVVTGKVPTTDGSGAKYYRLPRPADHRSRRELTMTEDTTKRPKPYGNGVTEPIHPIDPQALEDAANRFEAWLAFANVNRPGEDHIHQVSYEDFPIGDADLRILLVDYRHHRPTQWAYDRACEALHKQRARAEVAEAEVKRLTERLAEYVRWEPTVKEEYEHACAVAAQAEVVVKRFAAGPMLAVNQFVADLKNALEMQ